MATQRAVSVMPIRLHLGERPHEADSGERSVAGATRDARGATRDGVRQSDSERPQSLVISDPVCRGSVRGRWGRPRDRLAGRKRDL